MISTIKINEIIDKLYLNNLTAEQLKSILPTVYGKYIDNIIRERIKIIETFG